MFTIRYLSKAIVDMEPTLPYILFSGEEGAEVEVFLFAYDNFIMRGENEEEKAVCLFSYLYKNARMAYRACLSLVGSDRWSLRLCYCLQVDSERYAQTIHLHEITCMGMDACLERKN